MRFLLILSILFSISLSNAVFAEITSAQKPALTCQQSLDESLYLLEPRPSSNYFARGVVRSALDIKERSAELQDHSNYLREMAAQAKWQFFDLNKDLNVGMIDNGLSPHLADAYNNVVWIKDKLSEIHDGMSKEQLLSIIREVRGAAERGSAAATRTLEARNRLKQAIDSTQNRINNSLAPYRTEFGNRARRIDSLSTGIVRISYDLVGDTWFSTHNLDPYSKLGRLSENLHYLRRNQCISNK